MFESLQVTPELVDKVIKPFSALAEHGVLVSAGHGTERGEWNTMTASWALMGHLWNRPMAALFIRPQRHTALFAEEEDYLSVSFLDTTDEKMREALKICGTVSGRDEDKAARAHRIVPEALPEPIRYGFVFRSAGYHRLLPQKRFSLRLFLRNPRRIPSQQIEH